MQAQPSRKTQVYGNLTRSRRGFSTRLVMALLALSSFSGFASDPTALCKDRESYDKEFKTLDRQLSSEHPRLEEWDYLHRFYLGLVKRFPECDDGPYAQRLNDQVIYLLALYWNEFDHFLDAVRPDNEFTDFLLRHINNSGERKYLETIVVNTKERCPKTVQSLCRKIRTRAEMAMGHN